MRRLWQLFINQIDHNFVRFTLVSTLASVILTSFVFSGCGTLAKDGVYKGDKILYQAELTIPTSYSVIQTYVKWESENRAFLTKWPEITKSADYMRAHAKQWIASANNLHDAYKADPSQTNRDALSTGLGILQSALIEANRYMLQAVTGKN